MNTIKAFLSKSALSPALMTVLHMSTSQKSQKSSNVPQKLKKQTPQLHNKLAFNIFLVVPNFVKIITTVKIVKKTHAGKEGLIFEGLETAI